MSTTVWYIGNQCLLCQMIAHGKDVDHFINHIHKMKMFGVLFLCLIGGFVLAEGEEPSEIEILELEEDETPIRK